MLPDDWSDDVVVEEWTAPSDLDKPLFFFNLNAMITGVPNHLSASHRPLSGRLELAKRVLGPWWVPFQLFVLFGQLDNYPVLVDLGGPEALRYPFCDGQKVQLVERSIEHMVTCIVLFVVGVAARLFGVEAVTEERTPKDLWDAWTTQKGTGKKYN